VFWSSKKVKKTWKIRPLVFDFGHFKNVHFAKMHGGYPEILEKNGFLNIMLRKPKSSNFFCYDNFFYIFKKNGLGDFSVSIKMETNTYFFIPKNPQKFCCDFCYYATSNKKDFTKHLSTRKHQILTNTYQNTYQKSPPEIANTFACECGKKYKHKQSLHSHKKTCKLVLVINNTTEIINENIDNGIIQQNQPITGDIVLQLINQNQKLQEMLQEQHNKMYDIVKDYRSVTTNNNITNNNQFNLNFFLNEQCKDALNLMDFVNSLNVKLKDLEYTAQTSYAEGISSIFIKSLSDLNVHARPIHCSDSKRETIYIKDNGVWHKEDENRTKLTHAIKIVGNKAIKQISEWQKAYPDYNDPDSKQNDRYMKMICNAMSGSSKEESDKNYNKIIKNIAKNVIIDKCGQA
jgi:hypothetical protein